MGEGLFARIRTVCRKTALGLVPTLFLFLAGELVQRVRYSYAQDRLDWMYYGFGWDDTTPDVPIIPVAAPAGRPMARNVGRRNRPSGTARVGTDGREEISMQPTEINGREEASNSRADADNGEEIPNLQAEAGNGEEPPDDYLGKFDPSAINILCIGGSSTYGVFNDRRYTYPNLLSERFKQTVAGEAGVRFSVLNIGLSGQSSDTYSKQLDHEFAEYTPDVAIFYTGYNDIFVKDINRVYQTFEARMYALWSVIERYSLLLLTAKEKYLIWTYNQSLDIDEDRARIDRLEREFRTALEGTLEPLIRRDVPIILIPEVLMARNFGGIGHNYENYAERYGNIPGILEDIAQRHGAEFIDLQKDFDAMDFKVMFQDPVHLTDEGNQVLSQLIAERSVTLQKLASRDQ